MKKTKFLNITCRLSLMLLTVVLLLPACVSEIENEAGIISEEGTLREVRLEIKTPMAMSVQAPPSDLQVEDLYVLAFNKGKSQAEDLYEYYAKAEQNSDEQNIWKVKLNVTGLTQTYVFVANVDKVKDNKIVEALKSLERGTDRATVQQKLLVELKDGEKTGGFNGEGITDVSPITLCGQTDATLSETTINTMSVSLDRIVARIQVYFKDNEGNPLQNFIPETVRLYNFNTSAQVIPNAFGLNIENPSIPAGATIVKGIAHYTVKDNQLKQPIYLYETAQPQNEVHIDRPCLVIGGKYNGGSTTYYRVDLKSGDESTGITYNNVLRNHSYDVTVSKVSGEGEGSEEDALKAKPTDIEVTVEEWGPVDLGDITFDGKNFLGLSTMKFSVGKFGQSGLVQTVTSSKGLGWTAELLNVNDEDSPDWIRFENGSSEVTSVGGSADKNTENLTFSVDENQGASVRTARMRVKAGRLEIYAQIEQTVHEGVFIRLLSEEAVNITNQDAQTNEVKVEYGPANAELVWVLAQNQTQGIGLDDSYADGSEIGGQQLNEKTLTIPTNALPVTDKPYLTGQATVLLMARNDQGDAQMIKVDLVQKKLGVELVRKKIYAIAKNETVYVRSNFDWTATFDKQQLAGGLEKLTTGFTQDSFKGVATETSNNDNAKVIFSMLRPTKWTGSQFPAEIKFTSKEDDNFTCTVNVLDVFHYDGTDYEVYTSQSTWRQAITGELPKDLPDVSEGESPWKYPSFEEAKALTSTTSGATWFDISSNTKIPTIADHPLEQWSKLGYNTANAPRKTYNLDLTYRFAAYYVYKGDTVRYGGDVIDRTGNIANAGLSSDNGIGYFSVYCLDKSCTSQYVPAIRWKFIKSPLNTETNCLYAVMRVSSPYDDNLGGKCDWCQLPSWTLQSANWRPTPSKSGQVDVCDKVIWDVEHVTRAPDIVPFWTYRNCKHWLNNNTAKPIVTTLKWTGTKIMNTYFLKPIRKDNTR